MRRLRQLVRLVLRVEGSPTRVALAFAIGIFIAFFPVLGIHSAMALGVAFVFRLNRVAILAGSLTNNPWTVGPMFTAGTLVGCTLLGVSPASLAHVSWSGSALDASLLAALRPLLLPFVVGNLAMGTVGGVVAFIVLRAILLRRRSGRDHGGAPEPRQSGGASS